VSLFGSWVEDVEAICPCTPSDFDDGSGGSGEGSGIVILQQWGLIASNLLYWRTGRQYPGVCTDLVRPCRPRAAAVQTLAYAASGGSRPITFGSCSCGEPPSDGMAWGCGCENHGAVLLPHRPVRRVLDVTIDGDTVDPSDYRIVDRRWLVRRSGSWPCCQNLGAADGEPGTWSVEYSYGVPPPAGGAEMAGIYACELAKGCAGDETCRLPRRVTNLTREGVTMTLLDPFDFFDNGLTGLYEVDAWIGALNPAKLDRPGKVINVDLLMSHRVRP
jgi:hypothetical protein